MVSKSCKEDIFFKVVDVFVNDDNLKHAKLKGLDFRLFTSALVDDLEQIDHKTVASYWSNVIKKSNEQMNNIFNHRKKEQNKRLSRSLKKDSGEIQDEIEAFDKPGKVLHIDGDEDYLNLCLSTYNQLGIPVYGYNIAEDNQPEMILQYLEKHRPDILILTGHDGLVKGGKDYRNVNNYHNSQSFIIAVQEARNYEKNMDDLIIFAGACQSYYEAILEAGANFASSPKRVLIHAFDPVFVAEKIAHTSIYDPIPLKDVISGTITGFDGIGGFETPGKHRLGIPKSSY